MKNFALIFSILILGLCIKGKAQTQIGLKTGFNYVNNIIRNTSVATQGLEHKPRLSYHIGVFTRIGFTEKISLNIDLLFSSKGFGFKGTAGALPPGGGSLHLNYLNLPILFGYNINEKLTIEFGPEFGYLLSAKSKFESKTIDVKWIWDNELDLGISSGLTYSLTEKLKIGIRYTHGLYSVIKDMVIKDINGNLSDTPNAQNRTFQLSILFIINSKNKLGVE
jgi:hypothetical protein